MTYIEAIAKWNVGGAVYFELMRDAESYFYKVQGAVIPFRADKDDEAMTIVETIIRLQFPEAKVTKEVL